jgi:Alcohol dehydrogenase GroES-like domain
MKDTHKAVEVSAPGVLQIVERQIAQPGAGQVRIRVEACGVCHTDASTVTGTYPGLTLPRVPGHEVVGRIEALGSGVSRWKIGQRVGVGFFGGEDGVCEPCRRGNMVNCQNPVIPGVTVDGGYAEVMIAEARGIASIPEELGSAEAALSSALASPPSTLFAMPVCAAEIWSRCRASVAWDILVFNLRGTWVSILSRLDVEAKRKSSQRIWARTSTSIPLLTTQRRFYNAWAAPGRFLQQLPVVMRWGRLCPVSELVASSSWWAYLRTRCN